LLIKKRTEDSRPQTEVPCSNSPFNSGASMKKKYSSKEVGGFELQFGILKLT
jgi:hypothetical protein